MKFLVVLAVVGLVSAKSNVLLSAPLVPSALPAKTYSVGVANAPVTHFRYSALPVVPVKPSAPAAVPDKTAASTTNSAIPGVLFNQRTRKFSASPLASVPTSVFKTGPVSLKPTVDTTSPVASVVPGNVPTSANIYSTSVAVPARSNTYSAVPAIRQYVEPIAYAIPQNFRTRAVITDGSSAFRYGVPAPAVVPYIRTATYAAPTSFRTRAFINDVSSAFQYGVPAPAVEPTDFRTQAVISGAIRYGIPAHVAVNSIEPSTYIASQSFLTRPVATDRRPVIQYGVPTAEFSIPAVQYRTPAVSARTSVATVYSHPSQPTVVASPSIFIKHEVDDDFDAEFIKASVYSMVVDDDDDEFEEIFDDDDRK